jgi:hypothetical protein
MRVSIIVLPFPADSTNPSRCIINVKRCPYKITVVSTYAISNISAPEKVMMGFFLLRPASVKDCPEQA